MGEEYKKLVDERIGRALETGSTVTALSSKTDAPGHISDAAASEEDGFRKLLDAARRKRGMRRRILSAAAVFVCIFFLFGSLYIEGFFEPEETQAGRIPNTSANLENGSIVIGGDGNGNIGTWKGLFSSFEDVPDQYLQKIIWFDKIPEGYGVKKIKIIKNDRIMICEIFLEGADSGEIKIEETKGTSEDMVVVLKDYSHVSEINQMDVYMKKEKEKEYRVLYFDDVTVKIKSDAGMSEKIEAMIASIRTDQNSWS